MKANMLTKELVKQVIEGKSAFDFTGPMTDTDVRKAFYTGELYISPFQENNLTPIGYNFQASDVIISTRTGLPLKIVKDGDQKYVMVAPHDTVLITTKECLFVGERIMGTFHSRVRIVSQGFGHISTTLDPGWWGPLLIAVNNPSGKKKKFLLYDKGQPVSFVTLVLFRMENSPDKQHDNPPNRIDILEEFLRPTKKCGLLRGKARQQYRDIVDTLKDVQTIQATKDKAQMKYLDDMRDLLIEMGSQYARSAKLEDGGLVTKLKYLISDGGRFMDLPAPCADMIQITVKAIEEFDPLDIGEEQQSQEEQSEFPEFPVKFQEYLQICLRQIRYEQQAVAWSEAYQKCVRLSQGDNFTTTWMRIAIGAPWKEILCVLGLIATIALALFGMTEYNTIEGKKILCEAVPWLVSIDKETVNTIFTSIISVCAASLIAVFTGKDK